MKERCEPRGRVVGVNRRVEADHGHRSLRRHERRPGRAQRAAAGLLVTLRSHHDATRSIVTLTGQKIKNTEYTVKILCVLYSASQSHLARSVGQNGFKTSKNLKNAPLQVCHIRM